MSNDGRKVWATVLFLSVIMYRKVRHVNLFAIFCHTPICNKVVIGKSKKQKAKGKKPNRN